jgi:outer membrane protein assembly factor BamB
MRIIALVLALAGDQWTEFRGPNGSGHSDSTGLPREWSETKNIAWKAPLHGKGWSSPVVLGKQVWLTTCTQDGKQLSALCFDRETGKVLLDQKLFDVEKPQDIPKGYNFYSSPTPVLEPGFVYLDWGSEGIACLSTETMKVLWTRRDLNVIHWRGPGSSPILHKDLLILTREGFDLQYLVALDKKTGKNVWKKDRTIQYPKDDGDIKKCYSTPTVIEVGGKAQLVTAGSSAGISYDVLSGEEIWRVRYTGQHSTGARPIFAHGLVYFSTGAGANLIAVRPDGKGDVTDSHVAWKHTKGVGHKPSPIVVGDQIYSIHDNGTLLCLNAKTGAEHYTQRVGGKFSASLLFADGVIWASSEEGETVGFEPGPAYKEVCRNKLDGHFRATPAIVGKALYPRSETFLYRIEAK